MKKILLILIIILLLTGCHEEKEATEPKETETIEIIEEETYEDNNPIIVGLYNNGSLVHDYYSYYKDDYDVANFDVYFTNEEKTGSTNTKNNFNKYYKNYENISNYKIGFNITLKDNEKEFDETILSPDKTYALSPYIFVYLYDDINQVDGAWYSHVTKDTMKDNTIFSSIKLYMSRDSSKVVSPITLTVFTYDDMDDFDETGHYRGDSYYKVNIINKNY